MSQNLNFSVTQTQIKKLQQSIDRQLESSPLSKKMKASEIYNNQSSRPSKSNFIMQTSSIIPSQIPKGNSNHTKKQDKRQKIQKVTISKKSDQQKKSEQKSFLIHQNKNLKEQTLSLIEQLQNLLTVTKPKKYGINLNDEDQSKQLKIKKVAIASQLAKITYFQTKITYQQRQLLYVYDDQAITAQQADIKILEGELNKIEKQKKGIMNLLKQKNKGIQQMQMTPQFRQKFNRTKQQLQKIKQECKVLQNKTLQHQRLLRKKHQKAVGQHSKIKKLQKMIKDNNQKIRKGIQNEKVVTIDMIAQIQQQISDLQSQRAISQKSWASKITNIQSELETRKLEQERKALILKQKQKQVRLNDLRIKQLKKLSSSQTGQKRKVSMSGDETMKGEGVTLGRKRNIMFLQTNPNRLDSTSKNHQKHQEQPEQNE